MNVSRTTVSLNHRSHEYLKGFRRQKNQELIRLAKKFAGKGIEIRNKDRSYRNYRVRVYMTTRYAIEDHMGDDHCLSDVVDSLILAELTDS